MRPHHLRFVKCRAQYYILLSIHATAVPVAESIAHGHIIYVNSNAV